MFIQALTVCVNYSDLLSASIMTWADTVDQLVVVTTKEDRETQELCTLANKRNHNVSWYMTDAFFRKGATFNKAAAICEAYEFWVDNRSRGGEWFMFFDADIVPPLNWREVFRECNPVPGNLYGAHRWLENGQMINENEMAGWFQIFHLTDHRVSRRPLLETNWKHAGGYDSEFHQRWAEYNKFWLPFGVVHQGMHGENWFGRGNKKQMQEMIEERRRMGGIAPTEKLF